MPTSITTIDEYIAAFSPEIQERLQAMRAAIHAAAPGAQEAISYAMPAFKLNGNLVYFAGYKGHIGFYPVPTGMEKFKEQLAPYKTSKGGVQFPHNHPLPLDLVREIVLFRVEENRAKTQVKSKKSA